MPPPARLAFSHVGLFVTDLEVMTDFYTRALGFVVTDRGDLPSGRLVFLSRDPAEHHQLVLCTGRPPDRATTINQLSFRVGTLADLRSAAALFAAEGLTEIHPIDHGVSWSVYAHDPEGNRLELFVDTPWYAPQPLRDPLDLTLCDPALVAATEAKLRAMPGFMPMAEWRAATARRIAAALT